MKVPMVHPELIQSATALLLAKDCSLIRESSHKGHIPSNLSSSIESYQGEEALCTAREAASAYLVACFEFAATAIDEGETLP